MQAKRRSKGYVSVEAIRAQLPMYTDAQIRTAVLSSSVLRLSTNQASVRRVFGSRDVRLWCWSVWCDAPQPGCALTWLAALLRMQDILGYIDHIFGKRKYFGSWLHKHEDASGWVSVSEVAAFPQVCAVLRP